MRQYKVNLHSTLELLTGQENLCYNFGGTVQLPIIHIKGSNTHQFIKELIHQFIKELIQPSLLARLDTIGDTTQIKRQTREKRADNKQKTKERNDNTQESQIPSLSMLVETLSFSPDQNASTGRLA